VQCSALTQRASSRLDLNFHYARELDDTPCHRRVSGFNARDKLKRCILKLAQEFIEDPQGAEPTEIGA
jgi:hypothetical protein